MEWEAKPPKKSAAERSQHRVPDGYFALNEYAVKKGRI
jgi:hypothetical protein